MRKWSKEELSIAIQEVKNGKSYDEISKILNRSFSSVRVKLINIGSSRKRFINNKDKCICLNCGNEFEISIRKKRQRKFCSSSCSASYNNKKRDSKIKENIKIGLLKHYDKEFIKIEYFCLSCGEKIISKYNGKRLYCSNKCQSNHIKKIIFDRIENGDLTLNSRQYKNYLIHKYGEKCMECNWSKINPYTNKIPIEMEHIDGNYKNNKLDNLILLCPSCHSLTSTYKGANIGNGRYNRMKRYKEGKSF